MIKCDIKSKKSLFYLCSYRRRNSRKRFNFANNENDNENTKNNFMLFIDDANHNYITKILQIVVDFDFDFDFSSFSFFQFTFALQKKKKKNRNRKFKTNKFEIFFNFFNLFNIHFDFHFVDNVREFETMINFNVLTERIQTHVEYFFILYFLSN